MFEKLSEQKKRVDQHRPLPPELVRNLEQWFLVELTYTSNAIEGNTLTRQETAVVIEKGLTVSGKSLVEHLEATNHADALRLVMEWVGQKTEDLSERMILDIHHAILRGIDHGNAGHYRSVPVRISGSMVVLPNPRKVPDLMEDMVREISTATDLHPVELAAEAHYRLVTIHPFVDGNGRTARLLMNLILMQHGYPPALIRKRDRLRYLQSLEKAQLGGSKNDYNNLIANAVERSFDIYVKALSDVAGTAADPAPRQALMRIGQLAKATGESNATLRFWTKEGLLQVADTTAANYQLYAPGMVRRVALIRDLQSQRFTLSEIKNKLPE